MSGPGLRRIVAAAAATIVACAAIAALPAACAPPPLRGYDLKLGGDPADHPWNRTLYVTTERDGEFAPTEGVIFEPDSPSTLIERTPGDGYIFLSEVDPTPAIRSLLWMVVAKGKFGDERVIEIPVPRRTALRIEGLAGEPEDAFTIADPASGARLAALRNETTGLLWGVWDARPDAERVRSRGAALADEWRGHRDPAPVRPWTWRESKPGTFVVGVRSGNRQWLVQRVELKEGETTVVDATTQPAGGAKVTCEDARADLLIGGDLPLPPLRVSEVQFRAVWTNIPPGKHTLSYPDGRKVPVECADGADLKFGK